MHVNYRAYAFLQAVRITRLQASRGAGDRDSAIPTNRPRGHIFGCVVRVEFAPSTCAQNDDCARGDPPNRARKCKNTAVVADAFGGSAASVLARRHADR